MPPFLLSSDFLLGRFPKSPFLFSESYFLRTSLLFFEHPCFFSNIPAFFRTSLLPFISFSGERNETKKEGENVLGSGHVCPIFGITRRTRYASTASRISFLRLLRALRLNENSENRTDSKDPSCGNRQSRLYEQSES